MITMYFCFIVLLIVAQTRVYTNTDNFLSNFSLLSIYCKRAGWKYSPLMAKWKRGLKVREQEKVGFIQAQEWDRTGAQNEQELIGKKGADEKRGFALQAQNLDR